MSFKTTLHNIPFADNLVREYLIFRGFTKSLLSFDAERKNDRICSFRVDKIVDQFFTLVSQHKIDQIHDLWSYLEEFIFTKTSSTSSSSLIKTLDLSLKRYYLTNAIATSNPNKVKDFFDTYGESLALHPDWKDWFILPFIKNPQNHEQFGIYFTKEWIDSFSQTLSNFLSLTFQQLKLPTILNFNIARLDLKQKESQIRFLTSKLEDTLLASYTDKTLLPTSHSDSESHDDSDLNINTNNNNTNNNMGSNFNHGSNTGHGTGFGKLEQSPEVQKAKNQKNQLSALRQRIMDESAKNPVGAVYSSPYGSPSVMGGNNVNQGQGGGAGGSVTSPLGGGNSGSASRFSMEQIHSSIISDDLIL